MALTGKWPPHHGRSRGSRKSHETLGVPPTASTEEIKARYRQSILRIHSDVDRPVALFRQIKQAYEVLSDPVHRAPTINSSMLVSTQSSAYGSQSPHRGDPGSNARRSWAQRVLVGVRPAPPSSSASARRGSWMTRHTFASSPSRHPAELVALAGVC